MQVVAHTPTAYKLLHDGILALQRAEQVGMRIDVAYVKAKIDELQNKVHELHEELKQSELGKAWKKLFPAEFNPNSDDQLRKVIYDYLGLEPQKYTQSGAPATDAEALRKLSNQLPDVNFVREIRRWTKAQQYLKNFLIEQVNGILHPFFNLHTVKTYRSSSSNINFQNIPKRDAEIMKLVRRAILPHKGCQLLEIDYGSQEVRIACCYTKDKSLIQYVSDPSSDMHRDTAIDIFLLPSLDKSHPGEKLLRNAAKNGFVFPQFYGDYFKNCARYLWEDWVWEHKIQIRNPDNPSQDIFVLDWLAKKGIKTFEDFEEHVRKVEDNFWNVRFKEYNTWRENQVAFYHENGYVDLYTGFRCKGLMGRTQVINYPIQGSAFHCLLQAFIWIDEAFDRFDLKSRLIGQIHDAIVINVWPDELELVMAICYKYMIKKLMREWTWIIVPLEIEADITDVDAPWSEKRGLDVHQFI